MIYGSIFFEQFGSSIARVVRMREAVVNKKGVFIFRSFPFFEEVHDLIAVPFTPRFRCATPFGRIVTDGELGIRSLVAVSLFAGAHCVITGPIEDRRHREVSEIGRREFFRLVLGVRVFLTSFRQMPDGSSRHNHVT